IAYLEKALSYYENSDHQMMAAIAYNNLGINLTLVGQWDRAQEVLEHALALISEVDKHDEKISMPLDSLGELCMLRGDLDEAKVYLERAVELSNKNRNRWYECQAVRTLSRCHIATGETDLALSDAKHALELAEHI